MNMIVNLHTGMRALFVLFAVVVSVNSLSCNSSHFHYISEYAISKDKVLNRTFEKMKDVIQMDNATWRINSTLSYEIYNMRVHFNYDDSKQ